MDLSKPCEASPFSARGGADGSNPGGEVVRRPKALGGLEIASGAARGPDPAAGKAVASAIGRPRRLDHLFSPGHAGGENHRGNQPAVPASRIGDSVSDILKECAQMGLLEELCATLGYEARPDQRAALQAVRDLVYELAGAKNRDLAVDLLIHATGLAEFEQLSLSDYARKHGLSPEGFRKQVLAMQQRLNLPKRAMQRTNAN